MSAFVAGGISADVVFDSLDLGLVVSNDSCAVHFAAATGVPCVCAPLGTSVTRL